MSRCYRKSHSISPKTSLQLIRALSLALGFSLGYAQAQAEPAASDSSKSPDKSMSPNPDNPGLMDVHEIVAKINSENPAEVIEGIEGIEEQRKSDKSNQEALVSILQSNHSAIQKAVSNHPVRAVRRKAFVLYRELYAANEKMRGGYQWFMYSLTRENDTWLSRAALIELLKYPSKLVGISAMESLRDTETAKWGDTLDLRYYVTFYTDHGIKMAKAYYKILKKNEAKESDFREFHFNLYRAQFWLKSYRYRMKLRKQMKAATQTPGGEGTDKQSPVSQSENFNPNMASVWKRVYGRGFTRVFAELNLDKVETQLAAIRDEILNNRPSCTNCKWELSMPDLSGIDAFKTGYSIWRGARFYYEQVNE